MSSAWNVVFIICFHSVPFQVVLSTRTDWPSFPSLDPRKGSCVVTETESASVEMSCEEIQSPEELQAILQNYLSVTELSIQGSQLSHLPLMKKELSALETLVLTKSFLAFFAPPVFKDKAEQENIFFKKTTRLRKLEFSGVSYLHALNWSWIPDTVQAITIKDSRFVNIPQSFGHIRNLRTLNLQSSNVKWIHEDAFSGSKRITDIDLSGNSIDSLEPGTFRFLSEDHGYKLNLSNNKLKYLPENLIQSKKGNHETCESSVIFLDGNPLEELKEETFENTCIKEIHIRNTRIQCDCKYEWMLMWDIHGDCISNGVRVPWIDYFASPCNL